MKNHPHMIQNQIEVQRCSDDADYPSSEEIESWVCHVLADQFQEAPTSAEMNIRLVDEAESAELNHHYRHKSGPTNVLSFPFEEPPGYPGTLEHRLLGDIVICGPLVKREAQQQQKALQAHWAHLVIHGVLHLLGYDHQTDAQAEQMESREVQLLSHFKIPDPYQPSGVHPSNQNDIQ